MLALFSATAAMAQHNILNTPPEVSPMQMKPEMTNLGTRGKSNYASKNSLEMLLRMPLFYLTVKT
jgi:hypothetical protein